MRLCSCGTNIEAVSIHEHVLVHKELGDIK